MFISYSTYSSVSTNGETHVKAKKIVSDGKSAKKYVKKDNKEKVENISHQEAINEIMSPEKFMSIDNEFGKTKLIKNKKTSPKKKQVTK